MVAGGEIVAPAMPRTGDDWSGRAIGSVVAVRKVTVTDWSPTVGTSSLDREQLAVDVEQTDVYLTRNLDKESLSGRKFPSVTHYEPLPGHGP